MPRVHAAKNIGDDIYNEILFEHKTAAVEKPVCEEGATSIAKSSFLARKVGGILSKIGKIANRLSSPKEEK